MSPINQTSTALIVVDVQNSFLSLDNCKSSFNQALPTINRAIDFFRERGRPVIFTQTSEARKIKINAGYELSPALSRSATDLLIHKNYPNAFWQTELEKELKSLQISSVLVCGCFALSCVYLTHQGALERGFKSALLRGSIVSSDVDSIERAYAMTQTLNLSELDQKPITAVTL